MTYPEEAFRLLQDFAARSPLPRVRALHLPPGRNPMPDRSPGEFCALELADGSVGLSYVRLEGTWSSLEAVGPGAVEVGQDPLRLAQGLMSADPFQRALGLAAVNAVTRCLFDRSGFVPPRSGDSLGHLDPQPGDTIGMIGHFSPLIPRLVARGARVRVIELRADWVGEDGPVRVTLDPGELTVCQKILATGSLLLNGSLDAMLAHCVHAHRVALLGPSVGGPPDPLFARGLTLLGGTWLTDARAYVAALREGVTAPGCARKFALTPADWPGWNALLARC